MEPVQNLPTCISMEIEPETFEDWNIIESTACIIEEIFLDQIRVVKVGMKFVLFVSTGIPAKFRVLKSEPDTFGRETAVMATNLTQVFVAPKIQPSQRKALNSRTSSIKPNVVDKLTSTNTVNGFLKEFIHPCEEEKTFRILPKEFLKGIEFNFGHQSFVIALNEEKSTFIKKLIISLRPKISKTMDSKFPQHCIISSDLEPQFCQCSWIKIKYLNYRNIQQISTLNLSYSIQNENEEIPSKLLKAFLKNYFSNDEIYLPILMDSKGFQLHYKRNDFHAVPSLNLTVTPSVSSDTLDDRCFIFWPDKFPSISPLPILSSINSQTIAEKTSQNPIIENFGSIKSKNTIFNFQKPSINNLADKLAKLSKANENMNLLLFGENGSGRTNFIKFLAQNLFSNECFFSSKIDCFEWKGKSLETIEKQFDEIIEICETRMPSILFLDNLNFLNINMEDEDRKKFIDKVYSRIAFRLDSTKIHCIATTRSLYQLPESLLTIDGRRLFHENFEIPTMKEVSLFLKLIHNNQ
uniref:Peroxisomal ATPase PEX1 n=1 Tax=Panagrolaimus sp. PS1159 TaxID=55785 RepID=A0AC35FHZ4_9BILA